MTRIVPPIPGLTYTLVDGAGFVLTDPSGVVASWSIVNGVLEVVMNAATGIAYLLRTIAPIKPDAMHVTNVRVQRRSQSTTRANIAWGVGGDPAVDPLEFNGAGIGLEPFPNDDRPICWTSNVVRFAEPTAQDLYIKGLISVGAPTGNNSTTQAAVACGGVRNVGGESAAHRSTTDLNYPLAVEGFAIQNEIATAQTVSAEFATNVGARDYLTPGNTAPVLSPASPLKPIGPLTASLGWTLTDPSGIIASVVQSGINMIVTTNAVIGTAFYTRPLPASIDKTRPLNALSSWRVEQFGTDTVRIRYGLSDALGTFPLAAGVSANGTGTTSGVCLIGAIKTASGATGVVGAICSCTCCIAKTDGPVSGVGATAYAAIDLITSRGDARTTGGTNDQECIVIENVVATANVVEVSAEAGLEQPFNSAFA